MYCWALVVVTVVPGCMTGTPSCVVVTVVPGCMTGTPSCVVVYVVPACAIGTVSCVVVRSIVVVRTLGRSWRCDATTDQRQRAEQRSPEQPPGACVCVVFRCCAIAHDKFPVAGLIRVGGAYPVGQTFYSVTDVEDFVMVVATGGGYVVVLVTLSSATPLLLW